MDRKGVSVSEWAITCNDRQIYNDIDISQGWRWWWWRRWLCCSFLFGEHTKHWIMRLCWKMCDLSSVWWCVSLPIYSNFQMQLAIFPSRSFSHSSRYRFLSSIQRMKFAFHPIKSSNHNRIELATWQRNARSHSFFPVLRSSSSFSLASF